MEEDAWKWIFLHWRSSGKYITGLTVGHAHWHAWPIIPSSLKKEKTYPCESVIKRYGKQTWNGITFNVPEPIEPYLKALYGSTWQTPQYYKWDVTPFLTENDQHQCSKSEMPAKWSNLNARVRLHNADCFLSPSLGFLRLHQVFQMLCTRAGYVRSGKIKPNIYWWELST